jgi:hypothetical protein
MSSAEDRSTRSSRRTASSRRARRPSPASRDRTRRSDGLCATAADCRGRTCSPTSWRPVRGGSDTPGDSTASAARRHRGRWIGRCRKALIDPSLDDLSDLAALTVVEARQINGIGPAARGSTNSGTSSLCGKACRARFPLTAGSVVPVGTTDPPRLARAAADDHRLVRVRVPAHRRRAHCMSTATRLSTGSPRSSERISSRDLRRYADCLTIYMACLADQLGSRYD